MRDDQIRDMLSATMHRRTPSGHDQELVRFIRWGLVRRLGFDADIGHVDGREAGVRCKCTPRTVDAAGDLLVNPETGDPYKDKDGNDLRVLVGRPVEVDPDELFAMCCKDSTTADHLPRAVKLRRQAVLDELDAAVARDDARIAAAGR